MSIPTTGDIGWVPSDYLELPGESSEQDTDHTEETTAVAPPPRPPALDNPVTLHAATAANAIVPPMADRQYDPAVIPKYAPQVKPKPAAAGDAAPSPPAIGPRPPSGLLAAADTGAATLGTL